MNKEERLSIIKKVADEKRFSTLSVNSLISTFILEELKYAGVKAYRDNIDINMEFRRVLNVYDFDGYEISPKVTKYIKHYSQNPILASMQHISSTFISFIGEYYDGKLVKEEAK